MLLRILSTAIGTAAVALAQSAAPANSSDFWPSTANNTLYLAVAEGSGNYAQFNVHALTSEAATNLPVSHP